MVQDLHKFYNNATILVTGGTGFIGKVLVEKLVRCLNVKSIFLLVRINHKKRIETRLSEFMNESIFDRIHKERPDALQNTLKFISVDYSKDGLSIDAASLEELIDNVQIFFHMMVTVNSSKNMKEAINENILATRRVLALAKQMRVLRAFIHVSTIDTQIHRDQIDQYVQKGSINCERMTCMNNLELQKPSILGSVPTPIINAFTKRIAEELVESELKLVPSAIFRSPNLISTYKEPFPGWTDNLDGPTPVWMGATRGLIHCMYGDDRTEAKLMPVDYCANALVAVPWEVSQHWKPTRPLVYNYTYKNPTWRQHWLMVPHKMQAPLANPMWHYFFFIIRNRILYQVVFFILHMIPGYLLDALATVRRKKSHHVKYYNRLHRMMDHLSSHAFNGWTCDNRNLVALSDKLKATRAGDEFEFDGSKIDWVEYYKSYLPGIKRYYLKESFADLEQLRSSYKRLEILHYTILCGVFAAFVALVVEQVLF